MYSNIISSLQSINSIYFMDGELMLREVRGLIQSQVPRAGDVI